MTVINSTVFLAIICIQLAILHRISGHLQNDEDNCKQKSQVSRTFGKLDESVRTARKILETVSSHINVAEETCMKGFPSQVTSADIDGHEERESKILHRDCAEAFHNGMTQSGVYKIQPIFWSHPVKVFCDMKTNGGGWTVFQRRVDVPKREDFYRIWDEYKAGFGNLSEEFWLGNDIIFALSNQQNMTLRVDLEDFENNKTFAVYDHFRLRPESENYRLMLGVYADGNAGDALFRAKEMEFSTKDRKNDIWIVGNCAQSFKGAWWYSNCHDSNLNGLPHRGNHSSHADGINWKQFKGHNYSLKFTEMKIRPSAFEHGVNHE